MHARCLLWVGCLRVVARVKRQSKRHLVLTRRLPLCCRRCSLLLVFRCHAPEAVPPTMPSPVDKKINSNVSCIPRSCRYNLTKVKGLLDVPNSLPNTLNATFLNDILTTTYPNSISLKCKRRFISTQTCTQDFSPQCQANSTFDMQSRPCVPAKCKSPIEGFENVVSDASTGRSFGFNESIILQCHPQFVAICTSRNVTRNRF